MAKIALINPPLSLKERYGELGRAGSRLPPFGLILLAGSFMRHGFDAEIIDSAAMDLSVEETVKKVVGSGVKYVGITAVTASIHIAAELAKKIKEETKKTGREIIIIIGGVHVTACPKETFKLYPHFDYAVIGEGDINAVELLACLESNGDPKNILGIAFMRNELILTPPSKIIKDMDALPMPAWHLLPDLAKYYRPSSNAYQKLPAVSLITSRGCPGRCIFCDRTTSGNHIRGYSALRVLEMMKQLKNDYGIREIIFHDDNFITLRARLKELCRKMIEEKMNISWSCVGRIDMVTPELLRLMKSAGCWQIAYGIESGSQKMLDFMKKDITLKQIEEGLKWTKSAGIKSRGYFLIGAPNETEETINQTIDFMKKAELSDFHMSIFCPFPGTEALRMIKEDKNLGALKEKWREMTAWKVTFVPRGLTPEKILFYHKKAYRDFCLRPKIIMRYLKLLFDPATALETIRAGLTFLRFVKVS